MIPARRSSSSSAGASSLRAAAWASAIALVIHLVPLFLPRKVPTVELDLARALPDPQYRARILLPLLRNPDAAPAHLLEAAQLILPASTAHARSFLAEAERRDPTDAHALLVRARICRAEHDRSCVAQALAQARARLPQDPAPDLVEADFAEQEGDTARVSEALGRAYAKRPRDVELALRYARALGVVHEVDQAERVLADVGEQLPRPRYLLEHGLLLLGAGNDTLARAELEAAVSLEPRNGVHRYFLGVALYRLGEWRKAEAVLREADRLSPTDYRPLALICAIQREDRRVDDASATRMVLERRFRAERAAYEAACPP